MPNGENCVYFVVGDGVNRCRVELVDRIVSVNFVGVRTGTAL